MPEENLAANNLTAAAEETIIEKPENAKGKREVQMGTLLYRFHKTKH